MHTVNLSNEIASSITIYKDLLHLNNSSNLSVFIIKFSQPMITINYRRMKTDMNNPICIDKFFQRIKNKYLYVSSIIILILGLLLNRYGGIQFSLLHELILTGLLCFQIIIIKKHLLDMNDLSSTTTNTMVLGCIKRFWDRQNSIFSIFLYLLLHCFFQAL